MKRAAGTVAAALLAALTAGTALAHNTGTEHQETPSLVPPTVFVAGVLVLGTAVFLDSRDELSPRQANVGAALGVLAIVAGIGLLFL